MTDDLYSRNMKAVVARLDQVERESRETIGNMEKRLIMFQDRMDTMERRLNMLMAGKLRPGHTAD